jgi:poly(3-hydroxyalkanoate) depolymerase
VQNLLLRYARTAGPGRPLLFCNGIGANLELALPLVRELAGVPVLLFDLPGVGGSPQALLWPSYRRYARLVMGLLDQLDLHEPVDVAGVSWGSALALRIARDHPVRVDRLVLMAATHGWFMVPGRIGVLRRMLTPQRYLSRSYMAANAGRLYGGAMAESPSHAVEFARLTRAPSAAPYVQQLASVAGFNALPWLHRVSCPTLVMAGDDDPIVRPVNARVLSSLLPDARLHLVEKGGHLFMATHPRQTAAVVREFLQAEY